MLLVCIVHTALVRKGAGRDCMATPRRQQHEPCPCCCSLPPPGADIARRERGSTAGEGEEGVLSGDSMDLEGAGGSRAMPSPIAQSALAERQRQQQDGESACLPALLLLQVGHPSPVTPGCSALGLAAAHAHDPQPTPPLSPSACRCLCCSATGGCAAVGPLLLRGGEPLQQVRRRQLHAPHAPHVSSAAFAWPALLCSDDQALARGGMRSRLHHCFTPICLEAQPPSAQQCSPALHPTPLACPALQ